MGNMGTIPATGYESSVVQTFSSPTGTSHAMTYAANVSDVVLVINNVIQEPTVAFTTSGTTLTTATLVSGDTMYIIYLALSRQTVAPGADTVTNAMIVDNAINSEHYTDGSIDLAHMSVNSIDSDQYVDGSIDLVHMSAESIDSDQYVNASIDNAHLADDAVGVDELSATGTASSSTFLRGDNAWTAISAAKVVNISGIFSHAEVTTTAGFPGDDSKPQITEGAEILTLNHTMASTSNVLICIFDGQINASTVSSQGPCLFIVGTSDALAGSITNQAGAQQMGFMHSFVPGTVSEITMKVRIGGQSSTIRMNYDGAATTLWGDTLATSLLLIETTP